MKFSDFYPSTKFQFFGCAPGYDGAWNTSADCKTMKEAVEKFNAFLKDYCLHEVVVDKKRHYAVIIDNLGESNGMAKIFRVDRSDPREVEFKTTLGEAQYRLVWLYERDLRDASIPVEKIIAKAKAERIFPYLRNEDVDKLYNAFAEFREVRGII